MIDVSRPVGALIKEAGLTQTEVCNRTGIHPATLSRWVRGERKVPAKAYADIYNLCEMEMLKNGKKKRN